MEVRPGDKDYNQQVAEYVGSLPAGAVLAYGGESLATEAALLRYGDPGPHFGESIARSVAELRPVKRHSTLGLLAIDI